MKKLLLLTLIFAGCSTTDLGCKVEGVLINSAADTLASEFQCRNKDAIKSSLAPVIKKAGMCSKSFGFVCDLIAGQVADQVMQATVPAEWQCDPSASKEQVKNIVKVICERLI